MMGRSDRKSPERTDRHEGHRRDQSHRNERRERNDRHRERENRDRDGDEERQRYRSRSPHDRRKHRGDDDNEDVKPRIKQEKQDRGYEQNDPRNRGRTENVRIKQEHNIKQERGIKQEPVMNIKQEREMNDRRRVERRRHQPENPFQGSAAPAHVREDGEAPKEKEKPNFEKSGALTEDTNTYRGVVIKYNEPPEARKPKRKWRFYIFKGEQQLPVLHVHRQSAYLLGRDRKIADIPIDHPSCSKQHAVLQYRLADFTRDDGTTGRRVRPYVIDLESANGTFLNNQKIDPKRYYELQERDVIKFGFSSRDYVLLHANSKDEDGEEG